MDSLLPVSDDTADITETVQKPKKPLINGGLIVASVVCLAFGLLSAPYVFMIALSIALMVNFPNPRDQMKILAAHAPQALGMVAIILAAGAFWVFYRKVACLSQSQQT